MGIRPVLWIATAFLMVFSASAQPGGQERGGEPHGASASMNRPRANQGNIPPPPEPSNGRLTTRKPERFPSGHFNDLPHVDNNLWYGHEPPTDPRFHLDHTFEHGHFARFGPDFRYRVVRIDRGRHMFWFPGGFYFQVADWDWPLCAGWCWDCGDDFVIYEDPDHMGWYLAYNVHTGIYVHAMFMGT